MEFKAQVTQINENELDILFGGSAKKSDLVFEKVESLEENIFEQKEDNLDDFFGEEKEEVLIVEDKKNDKKKEPKQNKKEIVVEKELEEEVDLFKDDVVSEESVEGTTAIKEIVDYLIEKDIWLDFEGREEFEYNEDNFKRLIENQSSYKAQQMFDELLDQTGDYGKAIINHIKNNGNPDDIIDLFKLEKETNSIDISSIDGQESLITQYYSEDEIGWSKEKIKKYIDNLKITDELEEEAKEIKAKYDKVFQRRLEKINQDRIEEERKQQEKVKEYKNNVIETLKNRKDLTDKEKANVADYMLNYDQKLEDGQMVNKFYLKFISMQQNLNDFVDLVNFVMDKDSFLKKINKKSETEATKKAFSFIKNGNALKNKNSGLQVSKQLEDDESTNLFRFL